MLDEDFCDRILPFNREAACAPASANLGGALRRCWAIRSRMK
jgi:hypothetical protein